MADVDIEVESNDLKVAIEMLEGYEAAFIKMVNSVQTESNRMNRAAKASAAEVQTAFDRMTAQITGSSTKAATDWRKLERELTNGFAIVKKSANELFNKDLISGNLSGQSAKNSIFAEMLKKEEEAMKAAVLASQQYEREIQELTQKYNPLVAATQFYEQEVKNMTKANQLGVISAQQLERQLEQLKIEYDAINKGTYLAGSRFNQFGEMADGAGKASQRFGLYAQQAGYQIGDFAVQVQGGTNVGVAFSQQMAQLAGLIPGVAGAVTTFAAIGLGLLIQNLTRSEKEAKKAKEAYSEIGSILQELDSVQKALASNNSLVTSAKAAKQEYKEILEMMERVALRELQSKLDQTVNTFDARVKEIKAQLEQISRVNASDYGGVDVRTPQLNKELIDAQNTLFAIEKITGSTSEELEKNYTWAFKYLSSMQLLTPELEQQLTLLGQQLGVQDTANQKLKEQQDALTKQAELIQRINDIYGQSVQNVAASIREERQRIQLLQTANTLGEKSVEYLDLQKQFRLENLRLELEAAGVGQAAIDQRIRSEELLIDLQNQTTNELINSEANALAFADALAAAKAQAAAILSIIARMGAATFDSAALGIQERALAAGKTRIQSNREVDEFSLRNKYFEENKLILADASKTAAERKQLLDANNKVFDVELSNMKRQWNIDDAQFYEPESKSGGGGKRKGRGGGKSDAEKAADKAEKAQEKINEKFVDFIEDFALRMEQQKRLVGVYGEQRDQLEKVIEIENRLGDARQLTSQQQIEAWAREELALENLREMQDDVFNTISGNVENFLMEIVGGTESIGDAFRSLISSIISDLYQQLVAKPAANAIGGFVTSLFSAKGNAFGAGGVKMFANGGVVDSPTAFKYSGGLGVMGEAGPEAIMPLKRNSQGKLGVAVENASSGDVKVTQVFQFSANGDESVKAIIKQQLPKIQENTVQAVIEAKRRGRNGL